MRERARQRRRDIDFGTSAPQRGCAWPLTRQGATVPGDQSHHATLVPDLNEATFAKLPDVLDCGVVIVALNHGRKIDNSPTLVVDGEYAVPHQAVLNLEHAL